MALTRPRPPHAVALYGVRDPLTENAGATLARLAQLGFDHAEPFDIVNRRTALTSAQEATGFTFLTAHSRLIGADVEAVFGAALELGVTTIIDPFTEPEKWNNADDVNDIADAFNTLVPRATELGLRLAYHNHWWEPKSRIGDRTAFEYFVDRLDPAVGIQVDTYWAAAGGEDPAGLLRRLGERVAALHIKDGDLSLDGTGQTPAGQGRVDVAAVLTAAPWAQRIIEFDSFDGDIFAAIADSLDYLKETDA